MYGLLLTAALLLVCLVRLVVCPVCRYYADPKGLRKYPNLAFLAGISNIPFMIEATKGFRSCRLADMHKTHDVIRIGPNSLSYGSVGAVKDIYGHGTKCTKDKFYEVLSGTHYHLADVIDKTDHARKRKILSGAYAIKNLEGWEYKIADKTERLIKHFDTCCTEPLKESFRPTETDLNVDYREWTNYFTMDAIADIGLSRSLGFLDRGNDQTESESLDGRIRVVGYRDALHSQLKAQSVLIWAYSWYRNLTKYAKYFSKKYGALLETGEAFDGIVLHQARQRFQRYQKSEKLDDFFQALMETKEGAGNELEWGEIVAEMSIMLNAGSVSTAIAINNTMYLLLKHPQILQTLRQEIDSVCDDDEEVSVSYDRLKHLPYLRAVLDESMRILPPTTFGLPRRTPTEGCQIMGEFVAGNTSVSISSYVAHRDERAFPDPESFRPDRWLGERGKELQQYFITFSAGARGCIGRNISYLEQVVLLGSMLHRYEFALPSPNWEQTRYEHFNLVPGPLPLKVWRRHRAE